MQVSGTYLHKENETLFALHETWRSRNDIKKIHSRLFHVPSSAILSNLITALNSFGRAKECIEIGSDALDIPSIGDKGGMWLLTASMFSWSDERQELFSKLEYDLRISNRLLLQPGRTFYGEVLR